MQLWFAHLAEQSVSLLVEVLLSALFPVNEQFRFIRDNFVLPPPWLDTIAVPHLDLPLVFNGKLLSMHAFTSSTSKGSQCSIYDRWLAKKVGRLSLGELEFSLKPRPPPMLARISQSKSSSHILSRGLAQKWTWLPLGSCGWDFPAPMRLFDVIAVRCFGRRPEATLTLASSIMLGAELRFMPFMPNYDLYRHFSNRVGLILRPGRSKARNLAILCATVNQPPSYLIIIILLTTSCFKMFKVTAVYKSGHVRNHSVGWHDETKNTSRLFQQSKFFQSYQVQDGSKLIGSLS